MVETKRKYRKTVTDIHNIFFINSEMKKVTVHSPYEVILKEFKKHNIKTEDATLQELITELCLMLVNEYEKRTEHNDEYSTSDFRQTEFYKQIIVLLSQVKEVAYNLYSYDEKKMPEEIKAFYMSRINN